MTEAAKVKQSSWGQQQRLEFIEFRLCWEGRLNRSDLIDFFGISRPQASLDLARYIEMAPRNITYDRRQKTYLAAPGFAPALAPAESTAYLDLLLSPRRQPANFVGWMPPVGLLEYPNRRVKPKILRQVLHAVREHLMVRIEYQSMNRTGPTDREISPHAIGYDGFRWHARAFCHEHNSFRDFVFARILKIHGTSQSSADPKDDEGWHHTLDLVLAPHPDLTAGQLRAIALDYGMKNGRLVLQTRRALAFYVLRQLGLDSLAGAPRSQHIVLVNRAEVEPFLNAHE